MAQSQALFVWHDVIDDFPWSSVTGSSNSRDGLSCRFARITFNGLERRKQAGVDANELDPSDVLACC